MQEIPTFVAQPLPPDKHDHKGYIVLNRPYSIYQVCPFRRVLPGRLSKFYRFLSCWRGLHRSWRAVT